MDCQYLRPDKTCVLASCLANRPVEPWQNVCASCNRSSKPRSLNYVVASIAYTIWNKLGDYERGDELHRQFSEAGYFALGVPREDLIPLKIDVYPHGPGTELHNLLKWLRFEVSEMCPCLFWIREMNRGGSSWSRRHAADIVAAMLAEFARRYPKSRCPVWSQRLGAKLLIRLAVWKWNAKQT